VEDFQRYHSGKMPEQEMHALEKAALEDPFLEDALEGYAFVQTPVEDINEIRKKLFAEKAPAKIFWLKQKVPSQILKIAAVLVLFVGLGWLLVQNNKEKEVEIASIQTASAKLDTSLHTVPDSTITVVTTLPNGEPKNIIASLNKQKTTSPEGSNNSDDFKQPIAAAPHRDEEDNVHYPDLSTKDVAMEPLVKSKAQDDVLKGKVAGVNISASNVIKGRVVDKEGQPVPFASIKIPSSNTNIATDANGNFSLTNSQNATNVNVNVNAVGYETSNAALNMNNADNKIVLNESNQALSEVVVVGYGTKNNKKSVAAASTKKITSNQLDQSNRIILKNAVPEAGWENFNQALTEPLNRKSAIDSTGEVILLFDINTAGGAQNISIKKSLSDSCDAAAINLLQNAPAMKKIKKNRKAEATIRF
jgi:hypothetical protein